MVITSIEYANKEQTLLKVTCSDEPECAHWIPWPCNTWHREAVEAWLAQPGNTIGPWVDPVNYMDRLRTERNRRLEAIDWRVIRHLTQTANNETPTDDAEKMLEVYNYMKALRDFPETHPVSSEEEYNNLVWPTEPA